MPVPDLSALPDTPLAWLGLLPVFTNHNDPASFGTGYGCSPGVAVTLEGFKVEAYYAITALADGFLGILCGVLLAADFLDSVSRSCFAGVAFIP